MSLQAPYHILWGVAGLLPGSIKTNFSQALGSLVEILVSKSVGQHFPSYHENTLLGMLLYRLL